MKIKLDENIPARMSQKLRSLGHEADTVQDEGLGGRGDEDVWRASQKEERFLVTQDLDFSDLRRFAPGTHHGILLVRVPDTEQAHICDYLDIWFQDPDCETWRGCFVVATPLKLRVLRPPGFKS